jgi:hypothetical protein
MEIISLVAGHIESQKTLHYFIQLVQSINSQTDYSTPLNVRISLSLESESLRDELTTLFNITNIKNFSLQIREGKLSKFEHIKLLTNEIEDNFDESNTWILFSNAIDLWGTHRMAAYHHMITDIPTADYETTSSICYTNDVSKTNNNYGGKYTDYCVKLKYLKIFINGMTTVHLNHRLCDHYFVKFMYLYGSSILKRAFCAADEILYQITLEEMDPNIQQKTIDEQLTYALDYFMIQLVPQIAINWLDFCKANANGDFPPEIKRKLIELFLSTYENHLFNDKFLPVYKIPIAPQSEEEKIKHDEYMKMINKRIQEVQKSNTNPDSQTDLINQKIEKIRETHVDKTDETN